METHEFWVLGHVSDERVRAGLKELLASGYRTEARIIAHIAEVEERKLHLKDGSESLFDYCISRLRLSNSEAFHRITAARIARQFPIVFSLLEGRELHLTAVCLLRDYLTRENHRELLAEASHQTKWQVQELLARRFPRPDVASRIRKLPELRPATSAAADQGPSSPAPVAVAPATLLADAPPTKGTPIASTMPVRGLIEPTSEARYRIQLNASAALKDKLELLRALTSHSNGSGDLAVLIERAVDLALEEAQRRRFAKTDAPRKAGPRRLVKGMRSLRRGHIANATKRELAERDGMRCTYVSEGGHRRAARAFLQIHHEDPWARGGADTVENLRCLCGRHNRLLAERDFGAAHVAIRIAGRKTASQYQNPSLFKTHEGVEIHNAPAATVIGSPAASGQERTIFTRTDSTRAEASVVRAGG